MTKLLETEGLQAFYGDFQALFGVDISVGESEAVALIGANGAGKSTFLKALTGLVPSRAKTLSFNGAPVSGWPADRIHRAGMALVPEGRRLFPSLSVEENLLVGAAGGRSGAWNLDAVYDLFPDLVEKRRNPGTALSGGQQQMVAIGRALVRDPKLFLFDEPLSNLDAKLRVEMRSEIKKLHHKLGATMVYVTHDQIEAMTLATKIVVLKGGVVQQIGSPSEIYNRPANLFVADFMGSPAMNLIPAKARRNGSGTRIEIDREGGAPVVLHDTHAGDLPEDIILGLRPEDIAEAGFRAGEDVQEAECLIDMVEPAGADTYVVSRLGGTSMTARLHAETSAHPGESMTLAFDLGKVSYFSPESGQRLN